jgi:hypothetical protein
MHFFTFAATAAALTSHASGLNILLGNDDGFASAQLRETYRLLKKEGHNVVVVSEADNQSGQGGRAVFTNKNTLQQDSEYGIITAGAPSIGRDPIGKSDPVLHMLRTAPNDVQTKTSGTTTALPPQQPSSASITSFPTSPTSANPTSSLQAPTLALISVPSCTLSQAPQATPMLP